MESCVRTVDFQMVLQVGADALGGCDDVDAEGREERGRADAGELQQLRRGDGARADEHLLVGCKRRELPTNGDALDAGRRGL